MRVRAARETGICNIREELYSECLGRISLNNILYYITIELLSIIIYLLNSI